MIYFDTNFHRIFHSEPHFCSPEFISPNSTTVARTIHHGLHSEVSRNSKSPALFLPSPTAVLWISLSLSWKKGVAAEIKEKRTSNNGPATDQCPILDDKPRCVDSLDTPHASMAGTWSVCRPTDFRPSSKILPREGRHIKIVLKQHDLLNWRMKIKRYAFKSRSKDLFISPSTGWWRL